MRTILRYIPAMVAAANGIAVAAVVRFNQPNYPGQLLLMQVLIVLAALLVASRNRFVEAAGLLATIVSIFLTFSGMFLYTPTFIAVIWCIVAQGRARERASQNGLKPARPAEATVSRGPVSHYRVAAALRHDARRGRQGARRRPRGPARRGESPTALARTYLIPFRSQRARTSVP